MARWIVVPVKAPAACKRRLSGALDDTRREALVAAMLDHVVAAARATGAEVRLLGPERHGVGADVPLLADPGGGLNAALDAARAQAIAAGARRLLLVSADLPLVTPDDLAALIALPPGTIGIAPDGQGAGTNALSLPLPAATAFRFGYGAGSRAFHDAEARRLGLAMRARVTPGLAQDIDRPEDLDRLPAAMRPA